MPKRCYNCGISFDKLEKSERTKEHFPAQTHYNGYAEEYKFNRKTVPACQCCNDGYSKIDHYVRDAVGVLNENDPNKKELTQQAIRNLFADKKNLAKRLSLSDNGAYFNFDIAKLDAVHKKNFKCIYAKTFSKPISDDFKLDAYSDGHENKKLKLGSVFLEELNNMDDWQVSGHEKVFTYKIAEIDIKTNSLINVVENDEPKFMIAAMKYNDTITSLVIAAKPEIKELIKT